MCAVIACVAACVQGGVVNLRGRGGSPCRPKCVTGRSDRRPADLPLVGQQREGVQLEVITRFVRRVVIPFIDPIVCLSRGLGDELRPFSSVVKTYFLTRSLRPPTT